MKRLYFVAMLATMTGCGTPVKVSPLNPLRLLPFIGADSPTPQIEPSGPDYSWMYHALAIGVFVFAIVISWLAKRVTKSSLILVGFGWGVSYWALIMNDIKELTNSIAPWAAGIALAFGVVDVGIRMYLRYRKKV